METRIRRRVPSVSTIIFAILFAITLTTTIVLAAFSANKSASATINFANGVQLKVNGASVTANGNAADDFATSATLNWNITKGSSTIKTGSVTGEVGENAISLAAITFEAKGPESGTIYIAAKPTLTVAPSGTAPTFTVASGWEALGSTGYYTKSVSLNASGQTASAQAFTSAVVILASSATQADKNAIAGKTFTANLVVKASTTAFTASNVEAA
ncbi:MAG: hypothetical protein IKQ31_03290 [Clostridia bacterium]|nr:hypothetical protein [Clostridia bacterium]